MHISQLVSTPEGLRAVYVVVFKNDSEEGHGTAITDRPVDCIALLELDARDIRSEGSRQGAQRGRKTKVVGLVLEASTEASPAGESTGWFKRLYGDDLLGAAFLGYTRGDTIDEIMQAVGDQQETPEMNETRRFWARQAKDAIQRIVHG